MPEDIRWKQRLDNYSKALRQLTRFIEKGETWMEMIKSRIQTSHSYNEDVAEAIATRIVDQYYEEFIHLHKRCVSISNRSGSFSMNDQYSITEISDMLGFSEPCAFRRTFKRWAGKTPGQSR